MACDVVITGVGACGAVGSEPAEILSTLRRRQSPLTWHSLGADFPLLYGSELRSPLLQHRTYDYTAAFAGSASDAAAEQAQLRDAYANDRVATVLGCSKGRLYATGLDAPRVDPRTYPGETVGTEISGKYEWCGPVLNYPAACATGLACVIGGANLLRSGDADAVVAGSTESSGYAVTMAAFRNMGALSAGVMRPFHTFRDGFNPGEGAGAIVLEVGRNAIARGATPIARLAGFDIRADAHHITSPDEAGETIMLCVRRTLKQAGWRPRDVQYINAHGTGTPRNDAIEALAISAVFGDDCPPVSSLKPYLGHLLGGSAGTELAVSLLALRGGYIPPSLGLDKVDARLAPIYHVPQEGIEMHVSRFLKLSLGFGGHIACAAVEVY